MKNTNKHRLPAFTLMELTVSMLISAMVIGITYTAYQIVNRSYTTYISRRQEMAMLLRLDELLQKDFNRATGIYRHADEVLFVNDDRPKITYRFTPDYILRTAVGLDTFTVKAENLKTYFQQQSGTDSDSQTTTKSSILLDDLSVTVTSNNISYPYRYHKLYSSENLMKINAHAIH